MILSQSKHNSVNIHNEINKKIETRKLDELLILVPTNRKSRNLKKEIINRAPGSAAGVVNIETLGSFTSKLFFYEYSNYMELSEAAATVLLSQVFKEVKLKYFNNYKREIPQGTVERVKNVITEYKKHGITPEHLNNEANSLTGGESIKAKDIALIFEKYNEKCNSLKVKESADLYKEIQKLDRAEFNKRFRELFNNVSIIIADGFNDFTDPEIDILKFLSEIEGSELFISIDYLKENNFIYGQLENCFNKLKKRGFVEIIDETERARGEFAAIAGGNLFKSKTKAVEFKDKIKVITADKRDDEIKIIAKEIKSLLNNNKAKPAEICVAFNLIQNYSPFVRDHFTAYKIPFNLTDRISLSNSAPVVSLINFLEIEENNFYYKNIFRALSGGIINLPEINSSNLLYCAVKFKIIAGIDVWKSRLNEEIRKCKKEGDEREIKNFNKALYDIELLEKKLKPFSGKLTLKGFKISLEKLIAEFNLAEKILNNGGEFTEENIKGIIIFIETIDEIINLLTNEHGENKEFSLKFILQQIKNAITSTRFNIKEKAGYGVQITNLNELRGLKFKYLFIGGLCDGDLPTRYSPEIFNSIRYINNEKKHQAEERYLFYQALQTWSEGLFLSYPLNDDKKELTESNFLKSFCQVFETSMLDESGKIRRIYSAEELLALINDGGEIEEQLRNANYNYEIIKELIEVEEIRTKNLKSPYTGFIKEELDQEKREKLKELSNKEYSITQLENYAKCPYKYFAERILNLFPIEEPSEEIEALEMGSILHEILYIFYKRLESEGLVIKGCDDEVFKRCEEILFLIGENSLSNGFNSNPLNFYEKEKILGINGRRSNSILYKFLEKEREGKGNYYPKYFEKEFGTFKVDSSLKLEVDGYKLRGKIDRIDIDETNKHLKIIDYKLSGKRPNLNDLNEGISLQLPIYLYAASKIIEAETNEEYLPAAMEIYSLKPAELGGIEINLTKDDSIRVKVHEDQIIKSLSKAKEYISQISEGKYNLSELEGREEKVCRYCGFSGICRIKNVQ
jgi:ATP-dependent helicase/nuclease subunit B